VTTVDQPKSDTVRLAELMAAWSVVIDIGMGNPLEGGMRICLVATRLAEQLGLSVEERRRTYYVALLRHIGCTAANREFASLVGNEREFHESIGGLDVSSARALMPHMLRYAIGGRPLAERPGALLKLIVNARTLKESGDAICEVAQMLARRLELGPDIEADIGMVYERYDGKGFPNHLPGDAVSLPAQLVHLAEAALIHESLGGVSAATDMVRERRGKAFRPDVSDAFLADAAALFAEPRDSLWDEVIAAEPGSAPVLAGDKLDDALRALADFVDLKSHYTVGHSSDVARLAADAARASGMPAADVRLMRRAGWLHDIGRLSVSVTVWEKEGSLSRDEWEQVRLHAYYTERALTRPALLATAGRLAALHHERLDGSGYHRSQSGADLQPAARILAAADVYTALVAARPHRPALPPKEAAKNLRDQASDGRLDAAATDAVLAAAGHERGRKRVNVAGLTARELEVLALVARGKSTKEMATALVVSPRTVEHHIEGVYAKAGVRTRAAATMFALQNGVVGSAET
jgi:HD-GYP domain-containing protein (c-di-GMP phosphodiesterase class II)